MLGSVADPLPLDKFVKLPFRVAAPASRSFHLLITFMQTVFMWATFLGLMPWGMVMAERWLGVMTFNAPWSQITGIILFALCSALGLWSAFSVAWHGEGTPLPTATARHLVVVGPYRLIRNPMAIAGLGQGAAVGLWLGSWGVFAGVVVGLLIWQIWVRPAEETDLETRFGDEYRRYRSAVGCWWPRNPHPHV